MGARDKTTTDGALQQALAALRTAYTADPHPALSERRRWLTALERMIWDHQDALLAAVDADFDGRSTVETRLAELFPALQGIRHARRRLKGWMRRQRRPLSPWFWPASAWVEPQPLGVVGIVVPWNYPLFLALGPLEAALAAGNRVMVKMSEATPRTAALLARLLRDTLGNDVVRVVEGDAAVAAAFCSLPFDHLLFTGSTVVGRRVMAAAADNLTPVTLELGGKSPVIVAPGFDVGRAAQRIVAGKLLNAGQTCVAPDYVLVHESQRQALAEALLAQARASYPRLAGNADYTAIASDAHYRRLRAWLDEAAAAGARLDASHPESQDDAAARKLPLVLVQQCPESTALMQEEIFGPLLPLVGYQDFDAALAYVNARPRPLALYLFDDDAARVERALRHTVSGGVAVNDTLLHVAQSSLPFGGVGPSGMGHYHGHEGFLTFSKLRPVFHQSRLNGLWLTQPPYGRRVHALLRWMLGR